MELLYAIEKGDIDKVKLLLTNPEINPADGNNNAIRDASGGGHTEVVKLLLNDPRVNPAALNNMALMGASQNGHIGVVKLLLADPRVDPAAQNNIAIRMASMNGHIGIVRLLLADPRVDPADHNNQSILVAAKFGHTEVFKLLFNDPRVDWRVIKNKDQLIKNEENLLKTELTTSYLSLERTSPQVGFEGKVKSAVPKEILKQTVYSGPYQELCEAVKNSEIPPVKLVALAKILKVEYDNKIEWSKLCDKVKHAIFVSLYLHN